MPVYFIRQVRTDYVKVGYSADVDARVSNLQTGSTSQLLVEMVVESPGWSDAALEKQLHAALQKHLHRGEWFNLTPEALQGLLQLPQWQHLRITRGALLSLSFEGWLQLQSQVDIDKRLRRSITWLRVHDTLEANNENMMALSRWAYLLQKHFDYLQDSDLDEYAVRRCEMLSRLRIVQKQLARILSEISYTTEHQVDFYSEIFDSAFGGPDESVEHV